MAYTVTIVRIGGAGVPVGPSRIYEAEDEAEDEADALTIAAYEVDSCKPQRHRIATVKDAAGRLLFSYSGRSGAVRG